MTQAQTIGLSGYTSVTSVLNTVRSWFSVIFINDTIKGVLDQTQIIIDEPSLSFLAWHSPMLLSQVFLNLVKNSIDHNPKMIHTLQIRIYGEKDALIIEDNGVGVKNSLLQVLFVPEVTTKIDGDLHGLGLAICKEYCTIMGADNDILYVTAYVHDMRLDKGDVSL